MNAKNYLNGLSPIPSEEKLFCRATNKSGEHFIQPLPVIYLTHGAAGWNRTFVDHSNEEMELKVLTWIGDNFAWKPILSAARLSSGTHTVVNLTLAGRTGHNKATLFKNSHVMVDRSVYDLTADLNDGIWRRSSRITSGRSVSSVSGPEIPHSPALIQKWKGGSIHRATAQIVKAKEQSVGMDAVGITVEGSTNVVLASGLIVRTSFDAAERVPI